jgi:hypothetical protein
MKIKRGGFSLVELIIAIGLSSFVLIAICSLAGQVVRYQIGSIRSGGVTGWSLVSFSKMTKEIEDSNVLVWPSPGTPDADGLVACQNYSRAGSPLCGGGDLRLDCSRPVTVLRYCYQAAVAGPPYVPPRLWRYEDTSGNTCPASSAAAVPAPCDGSGAYGTSGVVAWNIEKNAGQSFFHRRDDIGGVAIRYVMGTQTPDEKIKVPIIQKFDVSVVMQKQYTDTQD